MILTWSSVADPVSGAFLIPLIRIRDPGWKKNPETGSGKNILDLFGLKILEFSDADPESGNL
jgi:hypothetical protein